jgi:translocator protein
MGDAVLGSWYENLNKAPWTPPGWVFGAAWTLIMIFFAVYMAYLLDAMPDKWTNILSLFGLQWLLNVAWNPTFFHYHYVGLGLGLITALTLLVAFFFFHYMQPLRWKSLHILPYLLWLGIATSLNAYILMYN